MGHGARFSYGSPFDSMMVRLRITRRARSAPPARFRWRIAAAPALPGALHPDRHENPVRGFHGAGTDRVARSSGVRVVHALTVGAAVDQFLPNIVGPLSLPQQVMHGVDHLASALGTVAQDMPPLHMRRLRRVREPGRTRVDLAGPGIDSATVWPRNGGFRGQARPGRGKTSKVQCLAGALPGLEADNVQLGARTSATPS